jgi:hypothetical protein
MDKKIKISNVVRNQLPQYVQEEYPLISEFLSQYYISQEYQGSAADLIQNIEEYVKVDSFTDIIESVTLKDSITFSDETITVDSSTGTNGFPSSYGLIQIDDEIITYTGITSTSFTGCIRGFCGVTSYEKQNSPDELVFQTSESTNHSSGSKIINLSSLFLKEFLKKSKYQLLPGFESREIYTPVKESTFIKQAKDFYSTKGTDRSFKILFGALYGESVSVIKPKDYLLKPSDAQYRVTNDFVVEALEGNPLDLLDSTLNQDSYSTLTKAYAPITNVEKIITKTGEEYYKLSIDSGYSRDLIVDGAIYGAFSVHAKTRVIGTYLSGATTITVDSTIGFPDSGELYVSYFDGTNGVVTYNSKSSNQFYECSGVSSKIEDATAIYINSFAYGRSIKNQDEIIKVRINSVINDLSIDTLSDNIFNVDNYKISIKTLGTDPTDVVSNNWIFNISPTYEDVSWQNISDTNVRITTKSDNIIKEGDSVEVISSQSNNSFTADVVSVVNDKQFVITVSQENKFSESNIYSIRRNLSKVNSTNYLGLNDILSDVQNVYKRGDSTYVASNSIPSGTLDCSNLSVTGDFEVVGINTFSMKDKHPFSSGDIIYYTPENVGNNKIVEKGIYYVKKISDTELKLSRGNSDIYISKFIPLLGNSGDSSRGTIEFYKIKSKSLKPQNLLREISPPVNDGFTYRTPVGQTGILVNGVEIKNYKSDDRIFYGKIDSIDVISEGNGYDVVSPPILEIEDSSGSGAFGYCAVEGSLQEIKVLEPGFDYVDIPKISITGGNGSGAIAEANIKLVTHEESFSATKNVILGSPESSVIGFSTYHKFRNGEEVVYDNSGFDSIGGLSQNSSYFVSVESPTEIKLYKNPDDVITGTAVSFTSYGTGTHKIRAKTRKITLGSINIVNSGSGYSNKKRTTQPIGINTSLNFITIKNHDYKTGDIIRYDYQGTKVSGLSTSKDYFVTKIDEDSFVLSEVGVGNTYREFYFETKQYVNLETVGVGTHIFNYPKISVEIIGDVNVSVSGGVTKETFKAKIEPSFKGNITSIHLENGGNNYGASNIINFDRQPSITLDSGSGCELNPIIKDGKIVDVIILVAGSNYNSTPNLSITGDGFGAVLYPIIENGRVVSVNIIEGGKGYKKENTKILVQSNGSGSKLYSKLQTWTVNLYERFKEYLSEDGGFLSESINPDYQLQYTNIFCPEKLIDGNSLRHSSIIGWAYDGNPIYGPYSYENIDGTGYIVRMKSSYNLLESQDNRPSTSDFPLGFFVEDYKYYTNDSSDVLDEYNGRFCVTPEFPSGTYAYFATIEDGENNIFPYLIGNNYKSTPNSFNFSILANQSRNFFELGLVRNTTPYGLTDSGITYSYLNNQNYNVGYSKIKQVSRGYVEGIDIISGGENYKVGDKIFFNNENTGGYGASAKVSEVVGAAVTSISLSKTLATNVELYPNNTTLSFTASFENPHQFKDRDIVYISGLSSSFYSITGLYQVGVTTDSLKLSAGIGSTATTGIVTYFSVFGNLNNFETNDILTINQEKVKILNVDGDSSRIKVLRSVNGTVGTSHSSFDDLYQNPRKLNFNFNSNSIFPQTKINKEIYFDPSESLGIGTQYGTGIGKTVVFSNPGYGVKKIFVPTKSIYLKGHNLETGDEVKYKLNGGTSIGFSTDGETTFTLSEDSTLYIAKISDDFVGVSTVRVTLGNSGEFVGVTDQTKNESTLYFVSEGSGAYHSFKTNYDIITSQVSKNTVTVSTAETHGLSNGDFIRLNVNSGISTTIKIKYNDANRRLIVNPTNFSSAGVNTVRNTIELPNHNLINGQKVIYNSSNPPSSLKNDGIYYVVVYDQDNIKLSDSFYNSTLRTPVFLSIESASDGTISLINPEIKLYKNSDITFDLSDSSLSYTVSGEIYSAFEFEIYTDDTFKDVVSDIQRTGTVGVDASITLDTSNITSDRLYYKLNSITKRKNLPEVKESIVIDYFVANNNILNIGNSEFDGIYEIKKLTNNSFNYILPNNTESAGYSLPDGVTYYTNSTTSYGSISNIQITNSGKYYYNLPTISKIESNLGSNAILEPNSKSIGQIKKVNLDDIGFDFSSDYTIRPTSYPVYTFKLEPLYYFNEIKITYSGVGYVTPPKLVVIDSLSGKEITDLELQYDLTDSYVTILKNTYQLSQLSPRIIPTNNSNGIGVYSVSFNNSTKKVTITLNKIFESESDFPFIIGDKILVENISITNPEIGVGYNSKDYNYTLFEITDTDPNEEVGFATIEYSLESLLGTNQIPGTFDSENSLGRVILEQDLIKFSSTLIRGEYFVGEEVIVGGSNIGYVESWNPNNGFITISRLSGEIEENQSIKGANSFATATISNIFKSNLFFELSSSSKISKEWQTETGFLNNDLQKIQDSFYYQNFSYSLKSKIDYDTWKDAVMTLNHPRGFKGFADYQLESESSVGSLSQLENTVDVLVDIISVSDLNTYYNFDTSRENRIQINSSVASNEIIFDGKILEDHILSIGNRVISIDDISWQFDSTELTQKKDFILTSEGLPIFKREFDGSSSDIINLNDNTIKINNHFFVTGEKISYNNNTNSTANSIGIGTTDFGVGIGLTDKLPSEVYVVKISDNLIKLSRTAEESLKSVPDTLDILSVGIGSTHYFSAFNQNSRVLISIDNVIQSPIVSTAITTRISQNVTGTSSTIYLDSVSQFFNGDLAKINNEIVKINSVGVGSTNILNVSRAWMGTEQSSHVLGDVVTKFIGNYNIIENTINFAEPPYGEYSTEQFERDEETNLLLEKSSFHGRSFIKSGSQNQNESTYENNYIFDDLSGDFSGISSNFVLKSSGIDVTGISSNNIIMLVNEIMQISSYATNNSTSDINNYTLIENSGITSVYFSGSSAIPNVEDINTSSLPRKGIIISVGSTEGFGYQPLISAGGTSVVSASGTIQSISIGNSGSGYRSGIQTMVNVGVKTEDLEYSNIHYVGTASISDGHVVGVSITNPGFGYTSTNPPIVVFDSPLSYTDIPLIYSESSGSSGIGTQSKIDIVVSNDSSVIEFEIKNFGYNYNVGDVLTISTGGATGIPTDTSKTFSEFKIFVDEIKNDKFSGWFVGKLQTIDDISSLFNGRRRSFPLSVSGDDKFTLYKQKGSKIDLNYNILVFFNDVLQVPYESYTLSPSGSRIIFSEAPKGRDENGAESGDKCKILFYMGNSEYDTETVSVVESVKIGDRLTLGYDINLGQTFNLQEEPRTVESLNLTSTLTLPYFGRGIADDESIFRPLSWSLQTEDLIINSELVSKSRLSNEPIIQPVSYLISPVSIGSSFIFVDNIRPFFNAKNESNVENYSFQNKITIVSQELKEPGFATAVVSVSGTVSSVSITDGGFGYISSPEVTFESPIGFGTTARATAVSSITSGIITSIVVTNGGLEYSQENPPNILIEPPTLKIETNEVTGYFGDYGIISGISTGSIAGVASTAIIFDLFIPSDSYLRDSSLTGISGITTISGIQTGYYFVVYNSKIGNGVTSLNSSNEIVGIGTTFLDNVYRAESVSFATSYVPYEGLRDVIKVVVSVSSLNGLTGTGFSDFYGEYSWGRINLSGREKSNEYPAETLNGVVGLRTGTIVRRTNQLRYSDYAS